MKALHDRLAKEAVSCCSDSKCISIFAYTYVCFYIHRHIA